VRRKLVQCKHIPEELVMRLAGSEDWPLDETIERELGVEVPYKVARAKVWKLVERGKLDYGVSWRYAFPTPWREAERA
jgi:hypothetical protein